MRRNVVIDFLKKKKDTKKNITIFFLNNKKHESEQQF